MRRTSGRCNGISYNIIGREILPNRAKGFQNIIEKNEAKGDREEIGNDIG